MSFFINDAMAQGAEAQQAPGFEMIIMLVVMFGIFYFLLIRPQQKKAKEHRGMVDALKSGDEIITNGGLFATIMDVTDDTLTCKLAENVEIKLQRHAVTAILPKGTIKKL